MINLMMKKIFLLLAAVLLTCAGVSAQASLPPNTMASLSGMLGPIMPTVVNVSGQGEIRGPDNPLAGPGQAPQQVRRFESLGSGVIVDADKGYILTNAHVLRDVQTITVTLSDGRVFKAKLVGSDPPSDVAVLQITADKLTAAQLGDSDKLKVGDFVAAIGNPFGLNQTVTSGIVSALERTSLGIEGYESFIQTDASINPGNSGGALVNLKGQLIGINTAIFAPSGGNVGIGFAIPSNMARSVMLQLIKYGSVKRGLMGVIVQDLTPALANNLHISGQVGAIIAQVTPNSPAAAAGIKAGDVIQAVDNTAIQNGGQVRNTVGLLRVGSTVKLKILRAGKPLFFSLTTADPDQYLAATEKSNRFLFGIALMDFDQLTPAMGRIQGVQILRIAENSMGWRSGLRPGDVIVSANQTPITNTTQLQQISLKSKDELLLNVLRGDGAAFVVVK
jgi:serine protease Do